MFISAASRPVIVLFYFILFHTWQTYYINTNTVRNKSVSNI